MTVIELMTCRVSEDPVFLAPVEGYVVSFMALYERVCGSLTQRLLHDTLASVEQNILCPLQVSFKESKGKLAHAPLAPLEFPHFLLSLFL
jgi:hypothetical protein